MRKNVDKKRNIKTENFNKEATEYTYEPLETTFDVFVGDLLSIITEPNDLALIVVNDLLVAIEKNDGLCGVYFDYVDSKETKFKNLEIIELDNIPNNSLALSLFVEKIAKEIKEILENKVRCRSCKEIFTVEIYDNLGICDSCRKEDAEIKEQAKKIFEDLT